MWKDYWHKCRLYAENEFATVQKTRAQRGQSNPKRIKHQTAVGKMGELIARDHLCELGYNCSDPDFTIYTGKKKSWDSDMHLLSSHGKFKVACKAQDEVSAKKFGRSWIFQKGGHGYGHTDPIIQKGESLSVFVSLNLAEQTAEVMGPFRMRDMRPLFKEPRVKKLRYSKVALYWEDMQHICPYNGVSDFAESSQKMSKRSSPSPEPSPKKRKVEPDEEVETTPHVIYVLDRSGSMSQFGDEGYGSVQAAIAALPEARGENCLLSVFTFDNKHEEVVKGVLAKDYVLPKECMEPRGMTALRDSLSNALEYANTLTNDVHVVIFTDGEDNTSKVDPLALKKMIKASKIDISWLAAGDAETDAATSLGIDKKDVLKVGGSGSNMVSAMRESSLKSQMGFSQMQRNVSVA
tara:strand:+ start:12377 stop:13597 length:1221 start_codon:yes stop_codon:yes gene_type:complete